MPVELHSRVSPGDWATPFVGRQAELDQLRALLADPAARLVTVLGPGGIGKTRLALELLATRAREDHERVFLPLAALDGPDEFLPALAEALGLRLALDSDLRRALGEHLADRRMLLVLDNFEHLLEAAPEVGDLLAKATGIQVLVTSREKLGLRGEVLVHLHGLPQPGADLPPEVGEFDAVRLFLQQAGRVRPGFALTAEDSPAIARICRLVDGAPLALLLAASWIESFSPQEIAERIERDVDFLAQELRDLPPRHRSLRAVFDSSFARLAERERAIFARLSVFRGGFNEEAALAVTGADLPLLLALVRKSLLWRRPDNGRYELHELLRQYAAGKLSPAETDALRHTHAEYFTGFLAAREMQIKSPDQIAALDAIQADWENVCTAGAWVVGRRDFEAVRRCIRSLYAFCDMRSRYYDGARIFHLANAGLAPRPGEAPHPVWALSLLSWYDLIPYIDRPAVYDRMVMQAQDCLVQARRDDDSEGKAASLVLMGAVAAERGSHEEAIACFEEAMRSCPQLDDYYWVNMRIGISRQLLEQYPASLVAFRASLARGRELGERVKMGWSLLNMGNTLIAMGEEREAEDCLTQALELFETIDTLAGIIWAKYSLARIALAAGRREEARTLAGRAREIAGQVHSLLWADQIDDLVEKIGLGPAAFDGSRRSAPVEPLSEREREILQLLRSDLDGPEIADRLSVSLNTLRFHTKNIYRKLQVDNRRAAVRRGEELGL
jgi:predicted ATPase/DNA-binding CsgD family transcriptional regulator